MHAMGREALKGLHIVGHTYRMNYGEKKPRFMAFPFDPSVHGLSPRCDINRDNRITPADAAIVQHPNAANTGGDGQVISLDVPIIMQIAEVPT